MGVLSKLADATRATIDEIRDRRMARIGDKPLKELSDAELERELRRRRRARGHSGGAGAGRAEGAREQEGRRGASRGTPGWKVRQWYRDLELEPGASLAAVEEAYERLLARYDPDKHADDPEKHRAAVKLAAGLGESYYALRDHLRG